MNTHQSKQLSSGKKRGGRRDRSVPSPTHKSLRQSNERSYSPPEKISEPDPDFGVEIEDQYYKRSVPSNHVMSPASKLRESSQPVSFQIRSPDGFVNGGRRPSATAAEDPLLQDFCDEDDLRINETQFAHLSIEGESQEDVDELAFHIGKLEGVEFENEDQYNEEDDFKQLGHQIELEDDFAGVQIADNSPMSVEHKKMLGLLESEQVLETSSGQQSQDDYGMRISSPLPRRPKASARLSSQATPQKEAPVSTADHLQEMAQEAEEEQLMRLEQFEPQTSSAHPHEILETSEPEQISQQNSGTKSSSAKKMAMTMTMQGRLPLLLGRSTENIADKKTLQVKSFVKIEGKLPSSSILRSLKTQSKKETDNMSASQQQPLTSRHSEPVVIEEPDYEIAMRVRQKQQQQVSQFDQQRNDDDDDERSQNKSMRSSKFESNKEEAEGLEDDNDQKNLERTDHGLGLNFNQVQKITNGTLRGGVPGTNNNTQRSDLQETIGAKLALRDLMNSASPSSKAAPHGSARSRNSKNQYRAATQMLPQNSQLITAQLPRASRAGDSLRSTSQLSRRSLSPRSQSQNMNNKVCRPEGHDTPLSMHHYSNDLEEEVAEDCSHEAPAKATTEAKLEQRLPACFEKGAKSASSSVKDDLHLSPPSADKEVNRAFLEEGPLDQQPINGFSEFKTNINFEFKAAASDSEDGGESHATGNLDHNQSALQSSEDEANLDLRRQHHSQTQQEHHLKSPSSRYVVEQVAVESSLGYPAANTKAQPQSYTSIGFATAGDKQTKQSIMSTKERSLSRVDQKRQIDTKLSLIRRNADKLKNKRREDSYKQTASTIRTRSFHNNTGNISIGNSVSQPRPLNWSRAKQSQKVLNKDLDRAPIPLSAQQSSHKIHLNSSIANKTMTTKTVLALPRTSTQNIGAGTHQQAQIKFGSSGVAGKSTSSSKINLTQSKQVYSVKRPTIPKQVILNAHKSMKQMRTTTSINSSSHHLPFKGRKGSKTIVEKQLQAKKETMPSKMESMSQQTLLDYKNSSAPGGQNGVGFDAKSFKSVQANNIMANSSLNKEKHYMKSAAKTVLETSVGGRPGPNPLRFDHVVNNSSSQTSLYQNTNKMSLQKLQDKYRKGSPRVYEADNNAQPQHAFSASSSLGNFARNVPAGSSATKGKPSMVTVFTKSSQQSASSKLMSKPPRSGKMINLTAAEVRENTLLDKQEQVLKVQLNKIEGKLDQKRREVSTGSRRSYQTPSANETRHGSTLLNADLQTKTGAPNSSSFASQRHQTNETILISAAGNNEAGSKSGKSAERNQQTNRIATEKQQQQKKGADSVTQSISKYKQKRSEQLQLVTAGSSQATTNIAKKQEMIKVAHFIQAPIDQEEDSGMDQVAAPLETIPSIPDKVPLRSQQSSTQQVMLSATQLYNPTKPVFESPRATTINQASSPSNVPTDNKQGNSTEERKLHSQVADDGTEPNNNATRNEDSDSGQLEQLSQQHHLTGEEQKLKSTNKTSLINTSSHADQKEVKTVFESINETADVNTSGVGLVRTTDGGYQALRHKSHQALKNGAKFTSLKNYMQNYQGHKGLVEPSSGSIVYDKRSPEDSSGCHLKRQISPNFSQVLDQTHLETSHRFEATFKPTQKQSPEEGTGSSKKDQKREARLNGAPSTPQDTCCQRSPMVSLTPILKDSSQASKLRKESFVKTRCMSPNHHQSQKNGDDDKRNSTSAFLTGGEKSKSSPNFKFYKSNLFKKLDTLTRDQQQHDKTQNHDSSDVPSLFSRPESSSYLGGIGKNHPILSLATDQTLLDISGNISHTQVAQNLRHNKSFGSQPSSKRPGLKKPPKTQTTRLQKKNKVAQPGKLLLRDEPHVEMKGVDFIEETKDYQRMITDLNDLLHNPRQPQPLGASSTSHITYHSQKVRPQVSPRPLIQVKDDGVSISPRSRNDKSTSSIKMSPRLMNKIQGQLSSGQKHLFDNSAVITVGLKQRQNQTIAYDSTVGAARANQPRVRSSMGEQTIRQQRHSSTLNEIEERPGVPYSHKRVNSMNSASAYNGSNRPTSTIKSGVTSQHASIFLRPSPGNIYKGGPSSSSQQQQQQQQQRTSVHNNTSSVGSGSQLGKLSKFERQRKEQFDLSLQREVEAIEKVISHRSAQKRMHAFEEQARQNNYVDSLGGGNNPTDVVISAIDSSLAQKATAAAHMRSDTMVTMGSSSIASPMIQAQQFQFQSSTEQKTAILMQQIRELEPMVLHAQSQNVKDQEQINQLMSLHADIQQLRDSSTGVGVGGADGMIAQQQQYGAEATSDDRAPAFGRPTAQFARPGGSNQGSILQQTL